MFKSEKIIMKHRSKTEGAESATKLLKNSPQTGEPGPFLATSGSRRSRKGSGAIELDPQHFLPDHTGYTNIDVVNSGYILEDLNFVLKLLSAHGDQRVKGR